MRPIPPKMEAAGIILCGYTVTKYDECGDITLPTTSEDQMKYEIMKRYP